MSKKYLGKSIYLSSIRNSSVSLESLTSDTPIFLSLHIDEEFDDKYNDDIRNICKILNEKNIRIIADISKKTLKQFSTDNINELAKELGIYALRIDYGFSLEEIIEIVKEFPIVLNASTISLNEIKEIMKYGEVELMHNFYPRKETALDEDTFIEINNIFKELNLKIKAFIPGKDKRGPLHEGLPTLERHRYLNSYLAFMEMIKKYDIDEVYLGDPNIDNKDYEMINLYLNEGIISLPVILNEKYQYLYNHTYTNRIDSPKTLIRILESREYSTSNDINIIPNNNIERIKGSITIDNELYKRYCGEIQIMKSNLPKDEKVNVIGYVDNEYLDLLELINRGDKFKLIKPSK